MLEQIDLSKKMEKTKYKEQMKELTVKLGRLQRECQKAEIPVMIVFFFFYTCLLFWSR